MAIEYKLWHIKFRACSAVTPVSFLLAPSRPIAERRFPKQPRMVRFDLRSIAHFPISTR